MVRARCFSMTAKGVAGAAAALALIGSVALPAGAAVSPNLLKNGTAEAAAGGTGGVVNVPGWTRETGTDFTAVKYGTPNFPSTTTPAPPNRGKNFFSGGPSNATFPDQVAVQTISLSKYVTKIKTGKVTFTAAGWFGGNGRSKDAAFMEVDFKNGSGSLIGGGTVGGVTPAQRGNKTELLHRLKTAKVPSGARSVFVQLIFDGSGTGAFNNAYADNVTLTLSGV